MSRGRRERRKVSAHRRLEEHKSGFQSSVFQLPESCQFFSLKDTGVKRLDFLCYPVGEGNPYADAGMLHYERTFFVHSGIGADSRSYVCPAKTFNSKCPICEFRLKGAKDKDLDDKTIKSLLPKERQLWILYDLEDLERGVQIWEVSFHTFGKKLDSLIRSADPEDNYAFFADPEDGMTVKASFERKTAEGIHPFFDTVSIEFKRRSKQYSEEFCHGLPCLDDLLIVLPYDKLQSVFLGVDENDDDVSQHSRSKPKNPEVEEEKQHRPKAAKAPWEGENNDEVEEKSAQKRRPVKLPNLEEEDEEATEPKKRSPSKSKAKPRDEGNETNEEDEQDEQDKEDDEWWEK